ncbi:hypothetical protein pipiens_017163, partial [Culex pipiens pipiens]
STRISERPVGRVHTTTETIEQDGEKICADPPLDVALQEKIPHPEYNKLICSRKARITYNLYNASNNELVRTKKLFKNAITVIDVAPFRRWYESHYLLPEGKRGGCVGQEGQLDLLKKYAKRQKTAKMYPALEVQFNAGRLRFPTWTEWPCRWLPAGG